VIPAILGVEHLRGAPSDKGGAARTHRFPVGTPSHPVDVNPEESEAVVAVAQFVRLVYIAATSRTDERTPSLRMINVDPVAACPALIYPDIKMTVIDHVPETTFVAQHTHLLFHLRFRVGHKDRYAIIKPLCTLFYNDTHTLLLIV
jgi:hypothetical protein